MTGSEKNIHCERIIGILPQYFLARRFLKGLEQFSAANAGPYFALTFLPPAFFSFLNARSSDQHMEATGPCIRISPVQQD